MLFAAAAIPTPRGLSRAASGTAAALSLSRLIGREARDTSIITAAASSPSESGDDVITNTSTSTSPPLPLTPSARAADTVTRFYAAWNAADPDGAVLDMAPDVEYWDTIYEKPFIGKENVREYFAKAARVLGPAVKFVVDGLSPAEDGSAVGVKWHCELDDGTPLPNSRGCSFYELRDSGREIARARDFVEPSVKPGAATLYLLRAVLPLVRLAARFDAKKKKGDDDGGDGKGGKGGGEGGPFSSSSGGGGSGIGGGGGGNSLASSGLESLALASWGRRDSLAFAFGGGNSSSPSSFSSLGSSSGGGGRISSNGASLSPSSRWGNSLTSLSLLGGKGSSSSSSSSSKSSSSSRSLSPPPSPPPSSEKPLGSLTTNSALVWLFYVAYFSFVFFSRDLPGLPVFETPPEVLTEVIHESWTFYFFVPLFNLVADAAALPASLRLPDLPEHPTSEALFNFVNAWSMMMLPVMLSEAAQALPNGKEGGEEGGDGGGTRDADKKRSSSDAFKWWLGVQFLTNVFMIPYMALVSVGFAGFGREKTRERASGGGGGLLGFGNESSRGVLSFKER